MSLTPELIALVTTVFVTTAGGVGVAFKTWADRRIAAETAEVKREQEITAALAASQTARIDEAKTREKEANERADKREETANRRMEAALAGMAQLTQVVTEMSATNKAVIEEVRRAAPRS